jgi:hypothetical protein
MFCNALFAFFCVQLPIGNSTAAMQNMGFGGVVTVETAGWSAFLGMGTDAPQIMNPAKLAKYCDANHKCIQYYRHCKPDGSYCDFEFALSGNTIPARITIKDVNARALDQIGIAIDPDKPLMGTPFSALTAESRDENPPVCEYYNDRKPDAGCPTQQPGPTL